MRNLTLVLSLITSIFIMSCEGPEGVPGRDGSDGQDGLNGTEGFVFEYNLNFTSPEYSVVLELPDNFEMLDSNVMMVYLLWEVTDDNVEVWRALPQTIYFDDSILSFNFDFTKYDALIFMDGTVDLDGLGADWTDNWIARVAVLPAQFSNARSTLDYTDYDQMKEYFDFPPSELANKDYQNRPTE